VTYQVDGIGEDRELTAPMQEVVSGHALIVHYCPMAATEGLNYGHYLALDELLTCTGPVGAGPRRQGLERMSLRLWKLAQTLLLATGRHAPYVTGP
jgi:hypothetical protein